MTSELKQIAYYLMSVKGISINHLQVSKRGIIMDTNYLAMYESDDVEEMVETLADCIRQRFDVEVDYELSCGQVVFIPYF